MNNNIQAPIARGPRPTYIEDRRILILPLIDAAPPNRPLFKNYLERHDQSTLFGNSLLIQKETVRNVFINKKQLEYY